MTFPIRVKETNTPNTYAVYVADRQIDLIESEYPRSYLEEYFRIENVLLRFLDDETEDDMLDSEIVATVTQFAGLNGFWFT